MQLILPNSAGNVTRPTSIHMHPRSPEEGYQATEAYDPMWRKVLVPPQFLQLICPMAEEIRESIQASRKDNLSGAYQYWNMVIQLRPYEFQLALLQASAGSPTDIALIQNTILQKAPGDLYQIVSNKGQTIRNLTQMLERRTAVLSPTQGFSMSTYHRQALQFSSPPSTPAEVRTGQNAVNVPSFLHLGQCWPLRP
ncbi:hypothetical protein B0H13DRAFT_1903734 [Mycena leptocephala]|nr:hypothetical protein B0H13DRAFT_1903734 [Mycena leptocephala]